MYGGGYANGSSSRSSSASRGPPAPQGGAQTPQYNRNNASADEHNESQHYTPSDIPYSGDETSGNNDNMATANTSHSGSPANSSPGRGTAGNELSRSGMSEESSPGGYFNTSQDSTGSNNNNFKVVVRVRPALEREMQANFVNCVKSDERRNQVTISEGADSSGYAGASHTFTFDRVRTYTYIHTKQVTHRTYWTCRCTEPRMTNVLFTQPLPKV